MKRLVWNPERLIQVQAVLDWDGSGGWVTVRSPFDEEVVECWNLVWSGQPINTPHTEAIEAAAETVANLLNHLGFKAELFEPLQLTEFDDDDEAQPMEESTGRTETERSNGHG